MMMCPNIVAQSVVSSHPNSEQNGAVKSFRFEVASIRPDKSGNLSDLGWEPTLFGYKARSVNMWQIIMTAYNPDSDRTWGSAKIVNAPKWVLTDTFDVEARVSLLDLITWKLQERRELLQAALQSLLAERCKLVVHRVSTDRPELQLIVSRKLLKIQASHGAISLSKNRQVYPDGGVMAFETQNGRPTRHFYNATMKDLADFLTTLSPEEPVRDMTGLSARYDFVLEDNSDLSPETKYTLAQWPIESLGLTLRDSKGPGFALFIDHIDQPDAN